MQNLLSIDRISKSFSDKPLFNEISFGLEQGEKMALVGKNGAGKSTLMKIIAGIEPADMGAVTLRNDIRVGYLPQDPDFSMYTTVRDVIFNSDNPVAETAKEYEVYLTHPEQYKGNSDELLERMDHLNAWDFDSDAKQVLGKLDIQNMEAEINSMSGGQKKRVALARLLLLNPDVLLLDEPTNHLDIEAVEWLEKWLQNSKSAMVMVTHDRYFMDNITSHVLELAENKLYKHYGSYSTYLENRLERQEQQSVIRDKAKNLMKKELEWLRRQPQARGTKAKYRIDAFEGVKEKATQKTDDSSVSIQMGGRRQGKKILELSHLSKSLSGKNLIHDFSYLFNRGDRVGMVGRNGVGKSTFLNLLTEKLTLDSGNIDKGETTAIGYYEQSSGSLNEQNRVIEELRDIAEYVTLADGESMSVSKLLETFLFPPAHQYTPIFKLSGGEKRRIQLLKVLVTQPNFLILDEPTNDFDIDTLNVLEQYLENFQGCLLIVSHDRYFLDKLCDHLFIFEGEGKIRDFPGNYTEYRNDLQQVKVETEKPLVEKTKAETSNKNTAKAKMNFSEKREYENLEKEISLLNSKKKDLEKQLNSGNTSHELLTEWSAELLKTQKILDEKELRWLELDEMY